MNTVITIKYLNAITGDMMVSYVNSEYLSVFIESLLKLGLPIHSIE